MDIKCTVYKLHQTINLNRWDEMHQMDHTKCYPNHRGVVFYSVYTFKPAEILLSIKKQLFVY